MSEDRQKDQKPWAWLDEIEGEFIFDCMGSGDCWESDHYREFTPKLISAIKELREALEFYGHPYETVFGKIDEKSLIQAVEHNNNYDNGTKARETLERVGKMG